MSHSVHMSERHRFALVCPAVLVVMTGAYVLITGGYESSDALVVLVPLAALVGLLLGVAVDAARAAVRRLRVSHSSTSRGPRGSNRPEFVERPTRDTR